MVRLFLLLPIALASSACFLEHTQAEGAYTFTIDRVLKDECGLASDPTVSRGASLQVAGEVVRLDYSYFNVQMVGAYLSGAERFYADGSAGNVDVQVKGQECLVDLVAIHLDATTQTRENFSGNLSVKLEPRVASRCACELWLTYSAHRLAP